MKHSVNNALTSMREMPELLLLEPDKLPHSRWRRFKTMHSMALRINEVMQRFSSLASEMREGENASQAETEEDDNANSAPSLRSSDIAATAHL